jgi:uncharacterized protein YdeI (YjbR/CyaY-like superfamily)
MSSSTSADVPADLIQALSADPRALELWNSITDIGRRDFIGWISSAKTEPTRAKRIRVCIDKLLSGKRRPCCYAVVPMGLYKALGESPSAKAKWSKLSSDERRDISDWIEASADKAERKGRVAETIYNLESQQEASHKH